MKFFTRKNFLQVAALVGGLGFVYTAFSAPPGSPYNLGETLAPTCAPGDANCTVVTPLQSGANSSATLGIGTASAPDAAVEIDTDTTGFPDSWAENLKLTSQQYPALWFHAENNNEGWLIANGDGADLSIATTDGTAIGDYHFVIEEDGFVGIGTTSPNAGLEIDKDTTTFPDGWADNLRVHSALYPATWFQAETANEGWILGSDQGDDFTFMTTDGTSAGDYLIKFEQNGQFIFNYESSTNFDEELHIAMEPGGSSDTAISIENSNAGPTYVYEIHVEDSNEFVIYQNQDENSSNSVLMYNGATQHWGFGTDPTANELQMDSGAHITAGGVFTDASSRAYKTGIESITLEEAAAALELLDPVRFQYKEQLGEEYLGFIAEDVPDLVATADRKGLSSMDIVAVLVKVNQQQQKEIAQLKELVCLDHPTAELCL